MSDLTDEELAEMDEDCKPECPCEMHRAVTEIRHHRAMVKRLEELAEKLESQPPDWPGIPRDAMAAELRNRMRTP